MPTNIMEVAIKVTTTVEVATRITVAEIRIKVMIVISSKTTLTKTNNITMIISERIKSKLRF